MRWSLSHSSAMTARVKKMTTIECVLQEGGRTGWCPTEKRCVVEVWW